MGIAQISSHVLVPPDGVTLAKDTCGQLFGYAWMALPLVPAHATTGNQCWTAFFNTKNFRGPVAFYLPRTWSRMSDRYPLAVGHGLDALPGIADSGAIEINTIPQFVSAPVAGVTYAKIPQLGFAADASGKSILMHDLTVYSKQALWDQVSAWVNGGVAPHGEFDAAGAFLPEIKTNPLQVRQGTDQWAKGVTDSVSTTALDSHTFGLQWKPSALRKWKGNLWRGEFPAYFKHTGTEVEVVSASQAPSETGLATAEFPGPRKPEPYTSTGEVWSHPGFKAGPFKAKLADGSVVTYCWYRFIDQPSLQNAGLTSGEKVALQALVEKIQRNWTPDKQYMAGPRRGELASLDPALLVRPPKGLEVGYVPIATGQG